MPHSGTARSRAIAQIRGALTLALAALVLACAPSDPPPTNPLAEDARPTMDGSPIPLPTFPGGAVTEAAPGSTPPPGSAEAQERVIGDAIARIAEWIGEPETDFRLVSIEARDWPSSCLGVDMPGRSCDTAITPGYLVQVAHVQRPDLPYQVHASTDGHYIWAPGTTPPSSERTIEFVDPASGLVTLESIGGNEDFIGTEHRAVPGSYLAASLSDLQPGQRVEIAVASNSAAEPGPMLIVWLTPIE